MALNYILMRNRISIQLLAALLGILAGRPVHAQQPVTVVEGQPIQIPTFEALDPNSLVPSNFSEGALVVTTGDKFNFTSSTITIVGGSTNPPPNGSCSPAIPANAIVQDCILGNTSFESNMVNLYLGAHGLPSSDASVIYQYGGIDLRNQIRSFMFAYIQGVVNETPAQLAANPNDQAVYTWLENAVKNNEITYYNSAVNEYYKWLDNPCQYQLNSVIAMGFGISYNGAPYCGASLTGIFVSAQAPDVSYFKEVGQYTAYDSKITAYDGNVPNSAVTGAQIMLQTQQQISRWSALIGLGPSIALSAGTAGLVAGNIAAIAPFANYAGDFAVAEAASAELTEESAAIGGTIIASDIVGAAAIVAIFVEIGVVAIIDQVQTDQNINAINSLIATNNSIASQTPNLPAMLQDSVGFQKIFETFIAATLPDLPSTQGVATPPIPDPSDPANDVFHFVDHTFGSEVIAADFNYTTWDPKYGYHPYGNPPYVDYGNTITAYSYGDGWFVQTADIPPPTAPFSNFVSATIEYLDPTSGINYIADRINGGRFLVSKAPQDVQPGDYICPVNQYGIMPFTVVPTNCSSFVSNFINTWAYTDDSQTVTIPQPPVFSSPTSFNFALGGFDYSSFSPALAGNPYNGSDPPFTDCEITAGTLPPGFVFNSSGLYIQVPPLASPGSYQVTFTGNCNFVPGYANIYGNAQTTQTFIANVVNVAGSPDSIPASTVRNAATPVAEQSSSGLQFLYPASTTSFSWIQGRAITLTVTTNGGPGTTITAGAHALPPGVTLTDNGNGTALIAGIPTGPLPACAPGCSIRASMPGLPSATIKLNVSVAAPSLPTIPANQNITWPAGQNDVFTVDGSVASNNAPTPVVLNWSPVGVLPAWVTFTGNANNILTLSGIPPVSSVNQTIALQYKYTYGGTPGFSSPAFTVKVKIGSPAPLLTVNPDLLFEVGAPGSGTVNSSTLSGATGLSGTFQVQGGLPAGLSAAQNGTSLTISGTPTNPGNYLIPIQFTAGGLTTTRSVAMMITQPASLSAFPSRLVLFAGTPTNMILPVTAGFPFDPSGSPGDGLPSSSGTNLTLSPSYSGGNGLTVVSNSGSLSITGTPAAPAAPVNFTVSAQTQLSTGPVGGTVSQPFAIYVQLPGDVNLDGAVNCMDYDLIKAHYGAIVGQANYLDLADPNHDGLVNVLDLAFVQTHLPKGTVCQ